MEKVDVAFHSDPLMVGMKTLTMNSGSDIDSIFQEEVEAPCNQR